MIDGDDRDPMDRLAKLEAIVEKQGAELTELRDVLRRIGIAIVGGGPEVAEDYELDSQYGDPPIKKDPTANFWKGPSHVGRRLSECSPDYLDAFAKYKDFLAGLDEKKGTEQKRKYADWGRKDAARARGWARRLRAGWVRPRASVGQQFGPLGGGAGFGHAGGETTTFGGGGNPFAATDTDAARVGAMVDDLMFGDGRPAGFGDAFEPPEHDAAPSAPVGAATDDFSFGANAGGQPAPSTGRVDLDDDDDELPVAALGGSK